MNRLVMPMALIATAVAASGAQAAHPQQGAANVRLVQLFLVDIRAAAVPPGREGYIQFMTQAFKAPPPGAPGEGPRDVRFFGDGEYVMWVSELPGAPGQEHALVVNMIRIVDGRFKEHWDWR